MKRVLLLLSLGVCVNLFGQTINVNPGGDPNSSKNLEQLIQDIFIGPSCASMANVTVRSYENVNYEDASLTTQTNGKSYAYFTNSGGNFPMDRGIILSSGVATESQGSNNYLLSGYQGGANWNGDADIKRLLDARFGNTEPTNNATVVEFEFVPAQNTFSFQYLFASEEYEEADYECSLFQDGFAFLIEGPGITADPEFAAIPTGRQWKNIALLGDGVTPVSVGTIHNNVAQCGSGQNVAQYVSHYTGAAATNAPINYNGRTVLLTASQAVQAGQTYTMKLVIADRSDDAFDSAVFLLAGSFDLGGTVDLGNDVSKCQGDSTTLTANSTFATATYVWEHNGSVMAGETGTSVNVTLPGTYTVTATLGLCVATDTVVVTDDMPTISPISGDLDICPGESTTLTVTTSDTGLTYQWQLNGTDMPGETNASLTTNQPGNYTVIATNGTGCTASQNATVTASPVPTLNSITGNTALCPGDTTTLTVTSPDSGLTYQWQLNGTDMAGETNASLTTNQTGNYTVIATNTSGCTSSESITVTDGSFTIAAITGDTDLCTGESTTLSTSTSEPSVTYQWQFNGTDMAGETNASVTVNQAGTYSVTATNASSCTVTENVVVNDRSFTISTIAGDTDLCTGESTTLSITSSEPGLTYQWQFNGTDMAGETNANVTVNQAGTYSVTATNAYGCTATENVVVTDRSFTISTIGGDTDLCTGESTTLSTTTTESGVAFQWQFNGTDMAGETNANVTVNQAGTYSVTATNAYGCTASENVVVTDRSFTITSITGDTDLCAGESTTLSTSTTEPGVTYQWQFNGTDMAGETNATVTVNQAGTYSVTATNAYGCTATENIIVNDVSFTISSIAGNTVICPGDSTTLSVTTTEPGVTYQWQLNGTDLAGETNTSLNVNQTGTYSVTATNTHGCTTTESVVVNSAAFNTSTIQGDTDICIGESTTLSITSAEPGLTYQWQFNGTDMVGETNASVTVNQPGTYSVTATNPSGCEVTESIVVNDASFTLTAITGDTDLCTGESSTLTTSTTESGVTYQWQFNGTDMAGETNASVTVNQAGSYSVTATNVHGCTATENIVVNDVSFTISAIQGNTIICPGDTTTLSVTTSEPSVTYQWQLNGTDIVGETNASLNVNQTGAYSVTVTNTFGCTATESVAVTSAAFSTSTIQGDTDLCTGESTTLSITSAEPGLTYQWQFNGTDMAGETNANVTVNQVGTYSVTATNANGCEVTESVVVNDVSFTITSITGDIDICTGESTTLSTSTTESGVTYQWQFNGTDIAGETNDSVTVNQAGSYSVTVTNIHGCTATENITVNDASFTITPITGDTNICTGESTTLTTSTTASGVTYQWQFNGSDIVGATNANVTVNQTGSYTVVATNVHGCISTENITVNDASFTITPITGNTTICPSEMTTLTTTSTETGLTYQWQLDGTDMAGETNATLSTDQTGAYTVIATNAEGCTASESIVVNSASFTLDPITGDTAICPGDNTTLTVTSAETGLTYQWQLDGVDMTGETNATLNTNQTGIYIVTATNANGCTATETITVTQSPLPQLDPIQGDTVICPTTATDLTVTSTDAGLTYQWQVDGSDIAGATSTTLNVSQAGTYTVIATNSSGCTSSESITVSISPLPNISAIMGDLELCFDETSTLSVTTADTGLTYQWELDGSTMIGETNASVEATEAGIYTVTATNTNGCTSTQVAIVLQSEFELSPIDGPTAICPGEYTQLTITSDDSSLTYQWTLDGAVMAGETSNVLDTNQAGEYIVTATNAMGCTLSETVTVVERTDCFIPQGISPNGDGLNDSFEISWYNADNIKIFNRYGTKVYEKGPYKNEWYGVSSQGHELPTGTYYYVIYKNGTKPLTGWVYVNRE